MSDFRVAGYGQIDPDDRVTFIFDGKTYEGRRGDTLASALLANGVHLMGRSFKYHRPRGVVTAGSDEPNALVGSLRGTNRSEGRYEPNTRATILEIYEGLQAVSQNRFPSLKFDLGAINDRLARLMPAGFYYKTFMWPRSFWDSVYEPMIRMAAGLGQSPEAPDPDEYASRYTHEDVLIIGAGPAGLAAALAFGKSGVDVLLVDENPQLGGSLLSDPSARINGQSSTEWLKKTKSALEKMTSVKILVRTTAIGYYHQNMVGLCQKVTDHFDDIPENAPRERMWRVRARQVILAQGALERPLVFEGNDRPGVMLASAAQTYLNRYGVLVGKAPAVITCHDAAWHVAFDLSRAGAQVSAIIDTRKNVDAALIAQARTINIPTFLGYTVSGTKGRLRVKSVRFNPVENDTVGAAHWMECDTLLMSGGFTPSLHLFSHTKGSLIWDEDAQVYLPGEQTEACHIAGAGRGNWGVEAALRDGVDAAVKTAGDLGQSVVGTRYLVEKDRTGRGDPPKELPGDKPQILAKAFVDFQNDVTAKDIRLAVREGFRSIEHIKRYTTTGMATDQGKLSNMNGLMIAADAVGKPAPQIGLTTFRPPYTPTSFGAFAGYHKTNYFDVTRKTPTDPWAVAHDAVFEPVALWRRARYFPKSGENMAQAVNRECAATRNSLGIFDASTLGKIEITGPDAVEFLNRMYTNPFTKLGIGRCRYGLLLGEDGYILDDGVIGRFGENKFHVTTTTGGAPAVVNMMEDYLQTEWPDLKVWLTSTSEHWATIALNGPNARKILTPLVEGLDLSPENFPHMSVAECRVAGFDARLFRVSFTGELGYEINVPARHGLTLWNLLMEAGEQFDICPYGTEAMHIMRAEKGYIIIGQETDGTVTPDDAGMSWAIGKKKADFVGKRGLARPDLVAPGRRQLVGLLCKDPQNVLPEGAQIVTGSSQQPSSIMIGHVTSSYYSTTLGHSFAMALLENGRALIGHELSVPLPDKNHRVEVVDPVFYDPENKRVNA